MLIQFTLKHSNCVLLLFRSEIWESKAEVISNIRLRLGQSHSIIIISA